MLKSAEAGSWLTRFHTLGRHLRIAVDELVVEDDGLATPMLSASPALFGVDAD